MSWYNRVIWTEGMFLRPQHFQQQSRYQEKYVEDRCGALTRYPWGFTELKLDQQLLSLGKIGIASARGVFPDGTPFDIPESDLPPSPLDVPEDTHSAVVYLSLATRREGGTEVAEQDTLSLGRYATQENEVRDNASANGTQAPVQIGKVSPRLLLEDDERSDFACIGITRILEMRANKNVVLDDTYVPTVMDCHATVNLSAFVKELNGLLKHRVEALSGRVSEAGRGGSAEIADYLLLQVVNRYQPLIAHYEKVAPLHPEPFYAQLLEMAGELATFTHQEKRAPEFDQYRHEDLQTTYDPVMRELRQSLSMVLEKNAIPLPLQLRKYGIRVSPITDRKLLVQANFVLVVRADLSIEELRRRLPTQAKIGPVEKIRELVNLALPGIMLRPLPVAPRQLPFRAKSVYFELDRNSEMWKQLSSSGGFAIHVGGEFPGIDMEFWAIKE